MQKEKKVNFKENFKKYLKYIWKYKWTFWLIIALLIIYQVANIVPKYLFTSLIDKGTEFLIGTITQPELTKTILILLGIFIGISIIMIVTSYLKQVYIAKFETNIVFDLKNKFFGHIIDLDHNFHTTNKSGSLISRLTRGAGAIEGLTDVIFFNIVPFVVQVIVIGVSLIDFNWESTIIILIIAVVFITYNIELQKKMVKLKEEYNTCDNLEKGNIADMFTNIDSIKYFGKNKYIKTKYKKLSTESRQKLCTYYSYFKYMDGSQALIIAIGTIAILFSPIKGFINGTLTIGALSFIYTTFVSFVGSLTQIVWGIRSLTRSLTDLQDLFHYEQFQKDIVDKEGARPLKVSRGEIDFNEISFNYNNRNRLFKKLNLKIYPKQTIAIVGRSGCGKTTLVKLLYRLYNLSSGSIKIDGTNIADVQQESLRNEMSIVPQEAILFDDTIYNNVKFAKQSATKEEVFAAMRYAHLDEFVKNLPNKYDTIVGERGVKLSGGQKQRVSIARAILANKKILVLDEATSSLDSETEHQIQVALGRLMKDRTSIVIAHRLSTIMTADQIIVMSNGKIVQKGTHRELITQGGEYATLWNYQKGGFLQD